MSCSNRHYEQGLRKAEAQRTDGGTRRQAMGGWGLARPHVLSAGIAVAAMLMGGCERTTGPSLPAAVPGQRALYNRGDDDASVVVASGNPAIDVPAVQAAVDRGGHVILRGHFSFDRPPTIPPVFARYPSATVLVSKPVTISGDEHDETTSIAAGTIPFFVNAPGAHVEIRGLRFLRPRGEAIVVYKVSGLVIASCRIQGMEMLPTSLLNGATGIEVNTSGFSFPSLAQPGTPENVSGKIVVANNDIDVGGSASQQTLGLIVWGIGVPGAEVEVQVTGNTIRNVTERGIYLSRVVGRTDVTRNLIVSGRIPGPVPPMGIYASNLGSHVIAHNTVHAQWQTGEAWGIQVQSSVAGWPMSGALVTHNDIGMEATPGTTFGVRSAGIQVRSTTGGTVQENQILNNAIRGHARAALAVEISGAGSTAVDNAFIQNRFAGFTPSLADVLVGPGAVRTCIAGPGTVVDHGDETIRVQGDGDDDRAHDDLDRSHHPRCP